MIASIYGDVHVTIHLDMTGRADGAPGWYLTEYHGEGYSSVLGQAPAKKWITPQQALRIAQIIADETATPEVVTAVNMANRYGKERVTQLHKEADSTRERAQRLADQARGWEGIES